MKRRTFIAAGAAGTLAAHGAFAANAGFTRPIQVIVPYATGGADTYVRPLQPALQSRHGIQLVIETVVGAGGTIGSMRVKRAARWCLAAAIRHRPSSRLRMIMHAANTVSRASVAASCRLASMSDTIRPASITVTATARISVPNGSPTRWATVSAWLKENGLRARIAGEYNGVDSLLAAVESGLGVALVAERIARLFPTRTRMKVVGAPPPERQLRVEQE